jgi:DNA-directed RNA polymerase subunit RPC12/RpoP
MLVEVACPNCRHRGHVAKNMLRRSLKCSECGKRAHFENRAAHDQQREAPSPDAMTALAKRLRRPSFVERAQVPDDLARLLWNDQG